MSQTNSGTASPDEVEFAAKVGKLMIDPINSSCDALQKQISALREKLDAMERGVAKHRSNYQDHAHMAEAFTVATLARTRQINELIDGLGHTIATIPSPPPVAKPDAASAAGHDAVASALGVAAEARAGESERR